MKKTVKLALVAVFALAMASEASAVGFLRNLGRRLGFNAQTTFTQRAAFRDLLRRPEYKANRNKYVMHNGIEYETIGKETADFLTKKELVGKFGFGGRVLKSNQPGVEGARIVENKENQLPGITSAVILSGIVGAGIGIAGLVSFIASCM